MEGATLQECASVNMVYPMRERDVILEFTLTPNSQFASKSKILGVFLKQLKLIMHYSGSHADEGLLGRGERRGSYRCMI